MENDDRKIMQNKLSTLRDLYKMNNEEKTEFLMKAEKFDARLKIFDNNFYQILIKAALYDLVSGKILKLSSFASIKF